MITCLLQHRCSSCCCAYYTHTISHGNAGDVDEEDGKAASDNGDNGNGDNGNNGDNDNGDNGNGDNGDFVPAVTTFA